jgi:hypothetical protein
MGFRLHFTIDKEMIDDNWTTPAYSEEILVEGNSITDTVCFTQDGQCVGFTLNQFLEMMEVLRKKSIWCEVERHFNYIDNRKVLQ